MAAGAGLTYVFEYIVYFSNCAGIQVHVFIDIIFEYELTAGIG